MKNGMLETLKAVELEAIQVRLDGVGSRDVTVRSKYYQAVDHGYATTIHENKGTTVDRAFVLASGSMDRYLTQL